MKTQFAILAALLFVSAGCMTTNMYDGPEQPPNEVAIVKPSMPTFIVAVDGKKVPLLSWSQRMKVAVLPGRRTLSVTFNEMFGLERKHSLSAINVTFEAEAGHIYHTTAETQGRKWHPEVIDEADNRNVSIPPESDTQQGGRGDSEDAGGIEEE